MLHHFQDVQHLIPNMPSCILSVTQQITEKIPTPTTYDASGVVNHWNFTEIYGVWKISPLNDKGISMTPCRASENYMQCNGYCEQCYSNCEMIKNYSQKAAQYAASIIYLYQL